LASGEELVNAAEAALVEGSDSKRLAMLAGETSPIYSDVEPQFLLYLKEAGIELPTQQEAARILLHDYLADIVESRIDSFKGMARIDKELRQHTKDKRFMGDSLGIESCYTWYRELQDAEDGSTLFYYYDLPIAEAVEKFKVHLIEEAKKALEKLKAEHRLHHEG
jgi:hypothetical protein